MSRATWSPGATTSLKLVTVKPLTLMVAPLRLVLNNERGRLVKRNTIGLATPGRPEAFRVIEQWIVDPRFEGIKSHLDQIRRRLRDTPAGK